MITINISSAIFNLRYHFHTMVLVIRGSIFLSLIVIIVYSVDKEVERIGVGEVIECPPVKNNFFLGEIHRADVIVRGEVIKNVRLTNCVKTKKARVTKKHKHWGFKSYYAANYVSKQ